MAATKYLREGIVSNIQAGAGKCNFASPENAAMTLMPTDLHWHEPRTELHNSIQSYPSGWWIVPFVGLGLYMWVLIINAVLGLLS